MSWISGIRARLFGSPAPGGRDWNQNDTGVAPDIDDILSERPPLLLRQTFFFIAGLFLTLIVIASVVNVDIIVVATGRVAPDAPTIVVQPMQLSIIREVRVKPGDTVKKGQVLAMLDPTLTLADKSALSTQQGSLASAIARLDAELNDKPLEIDDSAADGQLQKNLYTQRRSQYKSRLTAFDEDIARFEADASATKSNQESLAKQVEVDREAETMRLDLFNKKLGSKLNYLDAKILRMRTERERDDAGNHLDELQHSILSTRAQKQAFIDDWHRQLLEELVRTRAQASGVAEGLTKAVMLNDMVSLTAPEDGVVLDVAKRSVGSVLHEAEPLVTLVPSNVALIAEVMIGSADVGYTRPGQEVQIKIDAFPYQRHGMLTGSLRAVGEESFSSDDAKSAALSGSFHRSQITLTSMDLRNLPKGAHLIAGMTLAAEIKVGSRSVISYFLYPIQRGLSESLREP